MVRGVLSPLPVLGPRSIGPAGLGDLRRGGRPERGLGRLRGRRGRGLLRDPLLGGLGVVPVGLGLLTGLGVLLLLRVVLLLRLPVALVVVAVLLLLVLLLLVGGAGSGADCGGTWLYTGRPYTS